MTSEIKICCQWFVKSFLEGFFLEIDLLLFYKTGTFHKDIFVLLSSVKKI